MSTRLFAPLGVLALALAAPVLSEARAGDFAIDQSHSHVGFRVKHLVVSKVEGEFKDFDGSFSFDEKKPDASKVAFTIKAASINTNTAKRDEHLRSADFFDVQKFPTLAFESTKVEGAGKGKYKLSGNLTIHGVTKPVTFVVEYGGVSKDPWEGKTHTGFTATLRINRKDYGLTWNKALETGGFVVGEDVDITVEIEGIQKT
jgi:polyisoprenoid-binding protein YceI